MGNSHIELRRDPELESLAKRAFALAEGATIPSTGIYLSYFAGGAGDLAWAGAAF
jgi:hypothetical protein